MLKESYRKRVSEIARVKLTGGVGALGGVIIGGIIFFKMMCLEHKPESPGAAIHEFIAVTNGIPAQK
ncbi:MAG: hypothetical protein GY749_23655 [Desulfobacteraceae bacterium]|nr:hypothetical protein [Desulfobacteraceae bacterium]